MTLMIMNKEKFMTLFIKLSEKIKAQFFVIFNTFEIQKFLLSNFFILILKYRLIFLSIKKMGLFKFSMSKEWKSFILNFSHLFWFSKRFWRFEICRKHTLEGLDHFYYHVWFCITWDMFIRNNITTLWVNL